MTAGRLLISGGQDCDYLARIKDADEEMERHRQVIREERERQEMKECTHKPEVTPSRIFKPAPNCRRCERHRNDSAGDRLKKREQDLEVVQRPTRNVRHTAFTRRLFHQRAWRLTLVFSPQIHQAPAYVKRIARSMTHIRPVFAYPVRMGGGRTRTRAGPHI